MKQAELNLLLWCAQTLALVSCAALLARFMRAPAARLAFWQLTLVTSLLLPVMRPWQQLTVSGTENVTATTGPVRIATPQRTPAKIPTPETFIALILVSGAALKLILFATGLHKLRCYSENQ